MLLQNRKVPFFLFEPGVVNPSSDFRKLNFRVFLCCFRNLKRVCQVVVNFLLEVPLDVFFYYLAFVVVAFRRCRSAYQVFFQVLFFCSFVSVRSSALAKRVKLEVIEIRVRNNSAFVAGVGVLCF